MDGNDTKSAADLATLQRLIAAMQQGSYPHNPGIHRDISVTQENGETKLPPSIPELKELPSLDEIAALYVVAGAGITQANDYKQMLAARVEELRVKSLQAQAVTFAGQFLVELGTFFGPNKVISYDKGDVSGFVEFEVRLPNTTLHYSLRFVDLDIDNKLPAAMVSITSHTHYTIHEVMLEVYDTGLTHTQIEKIGGAEYAASVEGYHYYSTRYEKSPRLMLQVYTHEFLDKLRGVETSTRVEIKAVSSKGNTKDVIKISAFRTKHGPEGISDEPIDGPEREAVILQFGKRYPGLKDFLDPDPIPTA